MSTILVVDDVADIRLMMRLALSSEPHRILEASDGAEALAVLDVEPVDLMLLDIMMPVLDGIEVLERLGPDRSTPVVVVTGMQSTDDTHVAQLLELGALDVISKPFDPDWLVRLVDAVLLVDEDERQEYRRRRLTLAQRER